MCWNVPGEKFTYLYLLSASFCLALHLFWSFVFYPRKHILVFGSINGVWVGVGTWKKVFLILYALTDISLDELGLKLINSDSFSLYNFTSHIYILCTSTNVVLLVYLHCWKTLEGLITIHLQYHHIEFHTQTLSTATVILAGWLRYFF